MSDLTGSRLFSELGLSAPVLRALDAVGYEAPTPIQAATIPPLLEGRDLLGQAQTGTGKTAAFALPFLSRLDLHSRDTQLLVLTPTRELAIQVAEAFQRYAHYLRDFHILPVYGGQSYGIQLKQLRRGAQVVVGTPGRVMDHMRRGTLRLERLRGLVLDEADEMLRMGFIDDVQWILEQSPPHRQMALFSATMPALIRKVADRHLRDPSVVRIAAKTATATTVRQRYWQVSGVHKLDALTRMLEVETPDAVLVFVRTKSATQDLAEKLSARGYETAALNGDVPQHLRERVVGQLKQGELDVLVATDVAARGLDVERISHVINFDIPYDTEAYIHRIGRTGRAGRTGEAILFVAPREMRMLRSIERATRQRIEPMTLPRAADINEQRLVRFKERITDTLATQDLDLFYRLLEDYQRQEAVEPLRIAAALACLLQGDEPLLLEEVRQAVPARQSRDKPRLARDGTVRTEPLPLKAHPEIAMERFRIQVGYRHGVKPGNIVGAVANEVGLDSEFIGHIEIFDDFSTIDLPAGMPKDLLQVLKRTWVCQRRLEITRLGQAPAPDRKRRSGSKRAPMKKPGQG